MKAIIVHGGAGYDLPPPEFADGIKKSLEGTKNTKFMMKKINTKRAMKLLLKNQVQ